MLSLSILRNTGEANLNKQSLPICKTFLFASLLGFSLQSQAVDFFELSVDPSSIAEADKVTYIVNRSSISYIEIKTTKTPERAWYQLIFHTPKLVDSEKGDVLFRLECDNTKALDKIVSAVTQGSQKAITATEVCRKVDKN